MKNIQSYVNEKYSTEDYEAVDSNIYKYVCDDETLFVTSISFVQEEEYGEGVDSSDISQYPVEDICDRFFCYISDFYPELNDGRDNVCYLEFASNDIEDVRSLLTITGSHIYNKEVDGTLELVVE